MTKNKAIHIVMSIAVISIMVVSAVAFANIHGSALETNNEITTEMDYSASHYIEGLNIHPLKGTAVGVGANYLGGTVNLPFDVTAYYNLQYLALVVSDQKNWPGIDQRRPWDVPDGATLILQLTGSLQETLDDAAEIKIMIQNAFNMTLYHIGGHRSNEGPGMTYLIYHGRVPQANFDTFVDDFAGYVPDTGFGAAVTAGQLQASPIKAMGISILHERIPFLPGSPITRQWIPMLTATWVNPTGLIRDGSIANMSLTNVIPSMTTVQGDPNAIVSEVTMNLPYVVDVISIDPRTDNMYPHLKGNFKWTVKLDIPEWNITLDNAYDDIKVDYDFNLTRLLTHPQVIGEMDITSSIPIMGGEDLSYEFTWTNEGNAPAYNVTLAYGAFNSEEIPGLVLPVIKDGLSFNETQNMYLNTTTSVFSSIEQSGPDIIIVEGWFYNETAGAYLLDGETVTEEDFGNALNSFYTNETFLDLDMGDFSLEPIDNTNTVYALTTTIAQLNPGENVSKTFSINSLPTGTIQFFEPVALNDTYVYMNATEVFNWEDIIIGLFRSMGSSLHIPEDQTLNEPVIGSTYYYKDEFGRSYSGITNGLCVQLYDDEAILKTMVSLDKDLYRFGEPVNVTVELTNLGDVNATNVDVQLYHAFVTDEMELAYYEQIQDAVKNIPVIMPGETKTVNIELAAISDIGLHPVFAQVSYTSQETVDPDYPLIFSSHRHEDVFSNMDFGIILPPVEKEGEPEPTYPTPEVEVSTEIIGLTNETKEGDILTLRTTITNVGDEDTNIIYIQRAPSSIKPNVDSNQLVNVTIDGVEYTNYDIVWVSNPRGYEGMPHVVFAQDFIDGAHGIPLAVNETLIIEIEVEFTEAGEIVIPPAEIRYRSEYGITSNNNPNAERTEEASGSSILSALSATNPEEPSFTLNSEEPIADNTMTTNDWGSYSDSLNLVINELTGGGSSLKYVYIGLGVIAVTGVAVLIFFRANGGKKR